VVRAEAAAVNAMASGSQHRTMSEISLRMARSLSEWALHKLGHVADRPGLGLDPTSLGAQGGALGLEVGKGRSLALIPQAWREGLHARTEPDG
jgi:hypothetical protein